MSAPDVRPFFAIGAFAGLRVAEIKRLDWSRVNLASGFIEVTAGDAKTRQRRLVKIEANLAAWLAPQARKRGPVCGANHRKNMEAARRAAWEKAQELEMDAPGLEHWPDNALRHSYGSYWLAKHKNASELSLAMGNSPEMIFRHYREVVTPDEADRFWSIRPATVRHVLTIAA